MKKYGAKKDANHREIMAVIKAITAVHDLSACGYGVPDGLAWVNESWQLFDIKNPKTSYGRRGLNKRQQRWASDWRGGPVYLIYNVDEAQNFARGQLAALTVGQAKFLETWRGQAVVLHDAQEAMDWAVSVSEGL